MIEQIKRRNKQDPKEVCIIIYGSRFNESMKSFGPKCLYKDKFGKPMLETQIKSIRQIYPKSDIIITGGYQIEKVLKFKSDNIRVVENQFYNETNEVEDVRLALNNTNSKHIITISSDLIFNKYAVSNLTTNPTLVFDSKMQLRDSELGITVINKKVERIDLVLDEKKWCHISFFENRSLYLLNKLCNKTNNKLFLFEIINQIINDGCIFNGIEPNGMLIKKIQTQDHFRKLKEDAYINS